MNYRELEKTLYKYTDGWTKESGSFPIDERSEVYNVEAILQKHYNTVDRHHLDVKLKSEEGLTNYKVFFSDPLEELKESFDMNNRIDEIDFKLQGIEDRLAELNLYDDLDPELEEERASLLARRNELFDELYALDNQSEDDEQYFKDLIDEEVEIHSELNSDIWDGDELKPEVKDKLLQVRDKFLEMLEDEDVKLDVKDTVIVGSNASYNYTDNSDIDLHIVADTSVYPNQEELAAKIYNAYRRLFNDKFDPMIKGHEVEIYVEPDKLGVNSNGIYSLSAGWIKEPKEITVSIPDDSEINELLEPFNNRFDEIIANPNLDEVDQLINDIYILRQKSILEDGEFGAGNLAFKQFRDLGNLDELKNLKVELENRELSLN